METLEKNRVYSRSDIEALKSAATELFEQAITITKNFKTYASQTSSLVSSVPAEAKDYSLVNLLYNMSGKTFETHTYQDMKERLILLLDKLLENVYLYDKVAGEATGSLAESIGLVGGIIDSLKEFLNSEVIHSDISTYMQTLSQYQSKWTQQLITIEEKLALSVTVLKGVQSCCELSMDPVNLSTGNFVYQKTDLVIPGRGEIRFCRFYNGMDRTRGIMGRGWRHSFESSIKKEGENIILYRADGREEKFIKVSGHFYQSTYTGEKNLYSSKVGYEYMDERVSVYTYDEAGRLISQKDKSGAELSFVYDETGRLSKVTCQNGSSLCFTYEEELLVSAEDHTGRQVQFSYDEKKRLKQVTDPCGGITKYTYGKGGRIRTITDEEGHTVVENEYDKDKRIIKQTLSGGRLLAYTYRDEENRVIHTLPDGTQKIYVSDNRMRHTSTLYEGCTEEYEYDDKNRCISYTDRNGNRTRYEYYLKKQPVRIINAMGEERSLLYDVYGNPIYIRFEDGTEQKAVYDRAGRILCFTDENGDSLHFSYDEEGRLEKVTLPDGSADTFAYDRRGNVSHVERADGTAMTWHYDALNRVSGQKDGSGNLTGYEYDASNRLVRTVSPEGTTWEYTYDKQGKLIRRKDYGNGILEINYNEMGKPEEITDEDGSIITYGYDAMGNVIRTEYPEGGIRSCRYNRQNLLAEETNADGTVTTYTYDAQGNCTQKTDASGGKTLYTYDVLNRLILTTEADGRRISYTYDKRDRLLTTKDDRGFYEERSYDKGGRLLSIKDSHGRNDRYTYNSLGLPVTVQTKEGRVNYHYQKGGALIQVSRDDGTTIRYDYDRAGNVTRACYGDDIQYTYHYDVMNRLISVFEQGKEKQTFSYDAMGRLTEVYEWGEKQKEYRYSPGGKLLYVWERGTCPVSYTYDSAGRVNRITWEDDTRRSMSYQRDPMGRITEIEDSIGELCSVADNAIEPAEASLCRQQGGLYRYDLRGRLTEITFHGQKITYAYDEKGRLLSSAFPGGAGASYRYDERDRLLGFTLSDKEGILEVQDFVYDRRGLRTEITKKIREQPSFDGTYRYVYDEAGRLSRVYHGEEEQVFYGYDGFGNRILKREGKEETVYTYDKNGRLTGELAGGIRKQYRYERNGKLQGGTGLRHSFQPEVSICRHPVTGIPLAAFDGTDLSFYLTDETGSLLYGMDERGEVKQSCRYSPFGETIHESGGRMPAGFHGLIRGEGESYPAGERTYVPSLGRFLTEDKEKGTIYAPSSMNLYVYGLNNPLRYMDRSGNTPEELEGLSDKSGEACIREKSGADKVTETLGHGCAYLYQKAENLVTAPWGNPRTYQSAECDVQLSLETIQAMAGIPEGEQILKNTIPEESYIYQTSSYQDGVNQKSYDKSFAQTVEEQYGNLKGLVMQEFELWLNGYVSGWEDYHSGKGTDRLWAFLLGDWEGRREADAALREGVETAVEEVLDSKEVHGFLETVEEYTGGYKNFWEMIAAVRYMNAGYSPEEAVILAEENVVQNEKYLLSGMAMSVYDSVPGLLLNLSNFVQLGEGIQAGAEELSTCILPGAMIEANISPAESVVAAAIGPFLYNSISERLDTYFYGEDEEAYKAMGSDLGMVVEVAVSVATAGIASGGKAVQKEVMEETVERAVKETAEETAERAAKEVSKETVENSVKVSKEIIQNPPKEILSDVELKDISKEALEKCNSAGLSDVEVENLRKIQNTKKPEPETYLDSSYIVNHLEKFEDNGCYKIISDKRGEPIGTIGEGDLFVINGSDLDEILQKANGNPRIIEKELSMPDGYLGDNPYIIRADNPQNLRMATGNEINAWQDEWCPAGVTRAGVDEAVIDSLEKGEYSYKHCFDDFEWKK